VRHIAQNSACAPAADQDVPSLGEFEDLFRGVARQALIADLQPFAQGGAAFQAVMDGAFLHMHVVG
jgi:hypothetical protein